MKGNPTDFWGKFKIHPTGEAEWHPLEDHSADVAACFNALLTTTLWQKRLAAVGGLKALTTVQTARLSVLAALHDVGKYNIGFQAKADPASKLTAGHLLPVLHLFGGSHIFGGKYRETTKSLYEALDIEEMCRWTNDEDTFFQLLIATICHHGKPLRCEGDPDLRLWETTANLNPFEGIRRLVGKIQGWFPEAFMSGEEHILPSNPEFQHFFSGMLMLADWLGSDNRFFPFTKKEEDRENRMAASRLAASDLLKLMTLDPLPARTSMGVTSPSFSQLFPNQNSRGCQQAIIDLKVPHTASLAILEAETGSGKTEAALAYFAKLFHAGEVDGLYFALPTRTAATQIYHRICKSIKNAFPDQTPNVVLAVPGYLQVDGEIGHQLGPFEVLWDDDENWVKRYRGWVSENSKRYLAGSIIVGTIDQILLSALMVKHSHMRASCLLRHLIVVDEVHASDAYMNRILEKVLEHHFQAEGHALLMSATLGSSAKTKFSEPFEKRHPKTSDFGIALNDSYPQLSQFVRNETPSHISFKSNSSKKIELTLMGLINCPEKVAMYAYEAALQGAKVLIIRNTVGGALATQAALEELDSGSLLFQVKGKVTLHHSRYGKEDRKVLDEGIEVEFGKVRNMGGKIAVGTQTLQQSLDLDADLIITDLCPIDILLQRLGRLHRHQRGSGERPMRFNKAQAVILTPEKRNLESYISKDGTARGPHGFGTVYEDLRILDLTWQSLILDSHITIPQMNRYLVESSLHDDKLSAYDTLGSIWSKHANTLKGKGSARTISASLNCIDFNEPFGDIEFPNGADQKITTRLGVGDRLLTFPSPFISPFGNKMPTLSMPAWMCGDLPDEITPELRHVSSHEIIIKIADKEFIYDRLGFRRYEKDSKTKLEEDDTDV